MIDGDELDLFERSLERATANHSGAALDAALDDVGWRDALAIDVRAAVSSLFSLQGASNVTSSALDDVLGSAVGRDHVAVVLPSPGRWRAPGSREHGLLAVEGIATASVQRREMAAVVVSAADAPVLFEVDVAALPRRTIEGIDPSLALVAIEGEIEGARELGPVDWQAAVAVGQLALGHELVGASRRMLELAREHALDRVQFGQPIAMFQAVRHRLADTLVAIEAADAALDAAWRERSPVSAAMAKAMAGRAAA